MSSPTPKPDPIAEIANALMRAIAHSGIMRGHDDYDVATRIMREELENFLISKRYADERALIGDTPDGWRLAWSSLVLGVIERIHNARHARATEDGR
jgi:hypothetical protein